VYVVLPFHIYKVIIRKNSLKVVSKCGLRVLKVRSHGFQKIPLDKPFYNPSYHTPYFSHFGITFEGNSSCNTWIYGLGTKGL